MRRTSRSACRTGQRAGHHRSHRLRGLLAVVAALALSLLAPGLALAQQVVVVNTKDIAAYNMALKGFQKAYKGRVSVFELGKNDEVTAGLAGKIRAENPAVILAIGTKAAQSLRQHVTDVPVVFCMVLNPEKRGLSGSNITGVSLEVPAREQIAQFRRVVPRLSKIGVVYNPAKTGALVKDARAAAARAGVTLVEKTVGGASEVPDAVDGLLGNIDGFWLLPDATVVTNETFKHILVSTLEQRVPLMVFSRPFVKAGALMSWAANYEAVGGEAARVVSDIVGGKSAGSIPLRDPPGDLVINATTAQRLGLPLTADVKATAIFEN